MKVSEFDAIASKQLDLCWNTLISKSKEYSSDYDKLHNFRIAAKLQGCSMEEALGGMMAKHTISIYDLIKSNSPIDVELYSEKITDHINYLILLKAIILEQAKKENDALKHFNMPTNEESGGIKVDSLFGPFSLKDDDHE